MRALLLGQQLLQHLHSLGCLENVVSFKLLLLLASAPGALTLASWLLQLSTASVRTRAEPDAAFRRAGGEGVVL